MSENWENVKLKNIFSKINGLWTGKKEPFVEVKVYTMTNFTKDSFLNKAKEPREVVASLSQFEKRKLQKGDILVEKSGGGPNQPVGRAVLFDIDNDENNTFSNFTTRLRINENFTDKVSPNFIHHFLRLKYIDGETEKFQKNSTNIRNLQLDEYLEQSFSFPPLPEQQRIVSILDKAFAAIDKAKANSKRCLSLSKDLFESYLQGVFDPSARSGQGKGEGWEVKSLKELTTKIGSGATPRGGQKSYKAEGISLVRSMNVHDSEFRERKLAFIDEKQAKELNGVTLQENDVLLNITGASVARCCIFPTEYLPARVNQHVSIIRPKKDMIDARFLNLLLT
jgi:type I restriction enzyme S subunit